MSQFSLPCHYYRLQKEKYAEPDISTWKKKRRNSSPWTAGRVPSSPPLTVSPARGGQSAEGQVLTHKVLCLPPISQPEITPPKPFLLNLYKTQTSGKSKLFRFHYVVGTVSDKFPAAWEALVCPQSLRVNTGNGIGCLKGKPRKKCAFFHFYSIKPPPLLKH